MIFALNYSPAAARLLREGVIRVDHFKSADWPEMIADAGRYRPVYIHFPLETGGGTLLDLDRIETLRRQTQTPFVNTHLVCRRKDYPNLNGHVADPGENALVAERMIADLQPLIGRFGADSLIAENVIYHGWQFDDWLAPGTEAEVIRRVVDEAGCGLLLDLSHARIAAHYRGIDPMRYIESLPVEKLRELHITGLGMHQGLLTDHLAMTDEDWKFFRWALEQIAAGRWGRPQIVAFEYGGTGQVFAWRTDPAVIASQVPRLYDMVYSA